MGEKRFAENIDRLLGLHRLTAEWAAPMLGVSVTTLSYWRNGRREPDNVAVIKRVADFFEVDPFALLLTPFAELLPVIADRRRFESVERRIEDEEWGVSAKRRRPRRRGELTIEEAVEGAEQIAESLREDARRATTTRRETLQEQTERQRREETVSARGEKAKRLRAVPEQPGKARK